MIYQQDWLMRQIEAMIQAILAVALGISANEQTATQIEDSSYGKMLEKMIDDGDICAAEDLLFNDLDQSDSSWLQIALDFYSNVFNTISTNISLRRREFAMLKSVGMTQKGFRRMMNYECLLYGSKALLLGLPVSCGITYLIYRAVTTAYETSFHLPWAAIGIAVLSVFLVVFATMMYSMSKVKKDNPIDALKNENL